MILLALPLWAIVHGPVSAQTTSGVLVRIEAEGKLFTDPPTVELTPTPDGSAQTITLHDDGNPPDVIAGDGQWSGLVMLDASSATVRATINGEVKDGGRVEWESSAMGRELVISDGWAGIQVHAGVAGGNPPSAGAPQSGKPVTTSASSRPRERTAPDAPSAAGGSLASWAPWLPLGGGVLALLIGFGLAIRNARPPVRPMRLPRLPEPPLLGPGTPALHQGLSRWLVDPADRDRTTEALVRTMARHHRVLLVLPDSAPRPTCLGGPAYVTTDATPAKVEDHLIDLFDRPGLPVAVLVVADAPSPSDLAAYREVLDPDVGGIVLYSTPDATALPDLEVRCDEAQVQLCTPVAVVAVETTPEGWVVLRT